MRASRLRYIAIVAPPERTLRAAPRRVNGTKAPSLIVSAHARNLGVVLLRDSQHHGDQSVRQRFGQIIDQLGSSASNHGVNEFVGDLVDSRLP